jgi:hypothetical protein
MKKLLLFCLLFTYSLTNSQTLLETINLPSGTFYTSAYGMVHNNGKYWISSSSSSTGKGIIYAVNSSGVQVNCRVTPLWFESQVGFRWADFGMLNKKSQCDLYKVAVQGL